MAQTGDVKFGNSKNSDNFNLSLAGTGGSDLPNLKAEFTDIAHTRGILSAARSADPNSANSQFFICFESAPHLDRQYSAFGKVIKGMEFVDMIKKGDPNSGAVSDPDKIISLDQNKFNAKKNFSFELITQNDNARLGRISTPKGVIDTPAFMPVGTQGTVKGIFTDDILKTGTQIILGNTYHLLFRPGVDILKNLMVFINL